MRNNGAIFSITQKALFQYRINQELLHEKGLPRIEKKM